MIKIGLLGGTGRMGAQVMSILSKNYANQVEVISSPRRGEPLTDLFECDVIIDFSLPVALDRYLSEAKSHHSPPLVSGTTGLSEDQTKMLQEYSKKAPVLYATNFSTGVFSFLQTLKKASPLLKKLGYHPELIETHHIHKKDKPSGTAKTTLSTLNEFFDESIPVESLREGEVIGIHTVRFQTSKDSITITHHAKERSIFAQGAIDTAIWLSEKVKSGKIKSGMLSMEDYFNELS